MEQLDVETEVFITSCAYVFDIVLWLHNATYVTAGLALLALAIKNRKFPWSVLSLLFVLVATQAVDRFIFGYIKVPSSEPCFYLSLYKFTYLPTVALFAGYFFYEHRKGFLRSPLGSLFQADLLIKLGGALGPLIWLTLYLIISLE